MGGKPHRPKRRWLRRLIAGSLLLIALGVGLTVYLLNRPPAVWNQAQQLIEQTSPKQRAQIAEAVMQRLSEQVDADLEDEPGVFTQGLLGEAPAPADRYVDRTFELRLTNRELVAMADDTFAQWTAQRGYEVPDAFTRPVVMAQEGRLVFAFAVTTSSWRQVFSGELDLSFSGDGMAQGQVQELTAGSLPVSVVAVGEMLREQLPDSEADTADRLGDWLTELEGFEFRPVLELEHRRRARVTGMTIDDDAVTLRMRVQDHVTYRRHNELMGLGELAVTDALDRLELPGQPELPGSQGWDPGQFADVPTTTD